MTCVDRKQLIDSGKEPANGWQKHLEPLLNNALVALNARQRLPDELLSARLSGDPRANLPWRIVSNVLSVATFEIGHPVVLIVLMKTDNSAFHHDLR